MRISRAAVVSCAALAAAAGLAASSVAAPPTRLVSTVAGTGASGDGSDAGQPAKNVALNTPSDLALLPGGVVLVADTGNRKIRSFTIGGAMSTVAGDGSTFGSGDDNVDAVDTGFDSPVSVAPMADGGYLVADRDHHRIRRIRADKLAVRFAGSSAGFADGPAASAKFDRPTGIAVVTTGAQAGDVYVADMNNDAVRRISGGTVSTAVGTSPDGATAASTELQSPTDVAVLANGDLLVADAGNGRIVRVDRTTGTSRTVVSGTAPLSLEPAPDGGFLFASSIDGRIRHVNPAESVVVVAGGGTGADGSRATDALLSGPAGMAVTAAGQLLVAERGGHRVRLIDIDLRPAPVVPPTTPTDPPPSTTPADPPVTTTPADPPVTTTPSDPPVTTTPTDPTVSEEPATERAADPPAEAADPVAPVIGRRVVVAPASGRVLVRRPGAPDSVPLRAGQDIPVGSLVDASRGTVRLTTALPGGRVQTARFWGAAFAVTQGRTGDGTTELALRGGNLASCPRPSTRARTAAKRRKASRRLWGNDSGGRFRTRGRTSVATVRGTRWLTEDTCAGTLTRVVEGAVDVRDLRRGVTRRVRAGQQLLVRADGR